MDERETTELIEQWLAPAAAPQQVAAALSQAVRESIAPALALERLQALCGAPERVAAVAPVLARDPTALTRMLATVLVQSNDLTRVLIDNPSLLGWLVDQQTVRFTTSRDIYRRELEALLQQAEPTLEGVSAVLRRFRIRETFRIGVRDILNLADIYTIALELSFLADVIIDAALRAALREAERRHGRPRHADGSPASLAVLGLGKLGGEELNYSSDVDLMFIISGDGESGGEHDVLGARAVNLHRFFSRVATDLIALLSRPTEQGIAYRVDMRLRPEGAAGSLVRTLTAAETYFESFGEEWERQALLKARCVAGDTALGERFLRAIQPFTYRKYVDEAAVSETLYNIREMRLKTFAKYKDPDALARDVKNGPGGIRDVEFTVQAIQMLIGGRYPEIRLANTFRSLERIHQSGLLTRADYETLNHAYRFLRRVEHRIQMEESSQVYAIPADAERRDLLGRRLGFSSGEAFMAEYRTHTEGVRAIARNIFFQEHLQDDVDVLLTGDLPEDVYAAALEKYGLAGARWVAGALARMCEDERAPHLNTKLRRLMRALLPRVLTTARETPDPPLAIRNLERIVLSDAAALRATLFAALRENPEALTLLITICGASRFLSDLLAGCPSRLDMLFSPHGVQLHTSLESMREDLASYQPSDRSSADAGESPRLWRLRRWNGWQLLRAGAVYLLGLAESNQVYRHLSLLAACVLEEVLQDQIDRLCGEFSLPPLTPAEFGLTVIALGKFGGGECTFGSDLDVIFVYDGEPEWYRSRDGWELTLEEIYTRCATRLLRAINAPAAAGKLYETDARLRPYGKNSPLVLKLDAYRAYYDETQQTWERLMLTRARWTAGNPACGRAFEAMARQVVVCRPWDRETSEAILDMRRRIETAKSDEVIKAGYGGMIDVEFLAQAAQLRFGREHPHLCRPSTMATLQALETSGLLPTVDVAAMRESYTFLRDMETALRVVDNTSMSALPADPDRLEALVRRIYLPKRQPAPSAAQLLTAFETHTRRIRHAFEAFLAAE